MYKPIRSVELVKGGNVIKQGEKFSLSFRLFDEDGKEVNAVGKTITVKIANRTGVIYETTATVSVGLVEFKVDTDLGHGEMRVELTVTSGSAVLQKYPADGWIDLRITPSLDDLGVGGVNTITVAQLKNELKQMQSAYESIINPKVANAQSQSTDALAKSTEALAKASSAKTTAETVKEQFDRVVAEAGSSNPEVVQARGGEVNLNKRLDGFTQQLSDSERQTQILQTGLNVLNADVATPVDFEIQGRTLFNLLGKEGRTLTTKTVGVETTKRYLLVKFNQTTSVMTKTKYTAVASIEVTRATDECVALYEIAVDSYNKIGTTWGDAEVARRYPYVDSVQHLVNPFVMADGVNLLPPFSEWVLRSGAELRGEYKVERVGLGTYTPILDITLPVMLGQTYTLSKQSGNASFYIKKVNSSGTLIGSILSSPVQFTVDASYGGFIYVYAVTDNVVGTLYDITNPMLTLGSIPKSFVPQNKSYLYAETKLGAIGDKKDVLFKQDGQWKRRKEVEKDVVLDGSLGWVFGGDGLGHKHFHTPQGDKAVKTVIVSKYNGDILNSVLFTVAIPDNAYMHSDGNMYIVATDTDTGFGESFVPTVPDIKRYFNGWKYSNGTTWTSVTGNGQTAAAQVALNTKPTDYTPYKLSYVLATPVTENVTVEGDIVANGLTQVEVGSAVIVREKVIPALSSTHYQIDRLDLENSKLKHRNKSILGVYKNGIEQPFVTHQIPNSTAIWQIIPNTSYGAYRLVFPTEYFDAKAEYTVMYITLDKPTLTTNPTDVKSTYAKSLRNAHDDVAVKVSDNTTLLSVHERSILDLYIRLKALEVRP